MRAKVVGLYSSERGDLSKIWGWTIVIALAFTAMGVAGQTTPSMQTPPPLAAQEKSTPDTPPTVEDTETADNTAVDVDIQRRFDKLGNEIRRELLDDRAATIDWWLTASAIFLTSLGVLAAFLSIIGFSRFREIETEARDNVAQSKKHAEDARELVKEINKQKKLAEEARHETESIMRAIASDYAQRRYHSPIALGDPARDDEPLSISLDRVQREPDRAQEAAEAVQEVRRNPEASLMDRAIADAYSLQRAGRIDDAIERWRSIANIAEAIDNDLAARAWLSVGYLLYERGVEDAGEE